MFAFAAGAALPMLAIAIAGQSAAVRLRSHARALRVASGVLVAGAAFAMTLGLDQDLQLEVPNYVEVVQERLEGFADDELEELTGAREPEVVAENETSELEDDGVAPEFSGLVGWLNSKPLTLESLRGKVVLIDFWTYSCINCLRTLPYLKAWDERYRPSGLVIVGVHTPEFAFERVPDERARERGEARDRVSGRARQRLRNLERLAQPLLAGEVPDRPRGPRPLLPLRRGRVRRVRARDPRAPGRAGLDGRGEAALPEPAALADQSPHGLVTPESYLGHQRLARYVGTAVTPDRERAYAAAPKLGGERADARRPLDGRRRARGRRARPRGCAYATALATSIWC